MGSSELGPSSWVMLVKSLTTEATELHRGTPQRRAFARLQFCILTSYFWIH